MANVQKLNSFSIDYFSKMENKAFTGQFTARVASFLDKTKINMRRSQLLGGMYCVYDDDGNPTGRGVDEQTEWNAYKLAHLEQCLVQKPAWFQLEGLDAIVDEEVVNLVWAEVQKFELTFRGIQRPTTEVAGQTQSGQGTGAAQPAQAVGGNSPKKVVDGEVQAALEP